MIRCPHCGKDFDPDLLIAVASTREEQAQVIYDLYPRAGGAKLAKQKIVKALKGIAFEELRSRTETMANLWRDADKVFCPMASTWYHQERFNDPSYTWAPRQNGSHAKPEVPTYVLVKQLTEAIERHPANPQFVGYDRDRVTSAMREELKAWRGKLEQLQKLQMQAIT